MKRSFTIIASAASALVLHSLSGFAAEPGDNPDAWARWRGPLATGVAPNAKPVTTWSESENVKWKLRLPGFGTSTPIIWEDNVFVVTAIATGKKSEPAPAAAPAPEAPAQDAGAARRETPQGRRRDAQ